MLGLGPRKRRRRSTLQIAINSILERLVSVFTKCLKTATVVGLCAGAIWGLHKAQANKYRESEYWQGSRFELIDAPAGIGELILEDLAGLRQSHWTDEHLCERVYDRLARNVWIRWIHRISKAKPGVVRVDCEYRLPIAMIQNHEYFYLVDEYGVRLPGQYGYQPGWLLIQGVAEGLPQPGEMWPGDDIAAGVRLAKMILEQPYHDQVEALLLHNYQGRRDPYSAHIELVTDRDGNRILWGSAPGEELEENTAAQKLRILSQNYRQHGRIDANQPKIDISVFPDRFFIPAWARHRSHTPWMKRR